MNLTREDNRVFNPILRRRGDWKWQTDIEPKEL